jgi:RHS repeat-associated protein
LGRQRIATNPDGSYKEVVYANDANGKPYTAYYDELQHEQVTWKDAYGNLIQVREKATMDGVLQYLYTTYEYDLLGNPVRIMDARQNATSVTTTTWDSLGRKLSTDDPDMGHWTYTYYEDGSLHTQTDAKGQVTALTYDALGRITSKTVAGQLAASYYYDEPGYGASLGRLTRVVHANGSETHTWDIRGQELETTRCIEDSCQTIGQSYDSLGRVEAITYPDGEVVTYDYDDYGRLVNMGNASMDLASNLAWSSSGQLESMAYGNNTFTEFTYNPNRKWLSSATVTGPDGAALYNAAYTYDTAARVGTMTSTTNPLLNLAFTYDELNRLRTVSGGQSQTFAYDAIGNILYNSQKGTYNYDPVRVHAVTTAGTDSYTYDANGNMLSVNGTAKTFVWDANNRLTSVTNANGTTAFLYGPAGNRIEKDGPDGLSRYFGAMVEEKNGALIKYYYAGPMLIAKHDAGGTYWYHSDHLGSTRLMTDINGLEAKEYDYAAFGETVQENGSVSNERGFTGHNSDPGAGLIYMGARYYDASLARFISADTIVPDPANPQALNRYSYAYNNPISNTDPTGHGPVAAVVVGAIVKAAVATGAYVEAHAATIAIIGAAISIAGYALQDPVIASIGMVMLGAAGGGLLGTAVAGATSPISPLDPKVKEAVGWAYLAYGLYKAYSAWSAKEAALTEEAGQCQEEFTWSTEDDFTLGTPTPLEGSGATVSPAELKTLSPDNIKIHILAGASKRAPLHEILPLKFKVAYVKQTASFYDFSAPAWRNAAKGSWFGLKAASAMAGKVILEKGLDIALEYFGARALKFFKASDAIMDFYDLTGAVYAVGEAANYFNVGESTAKEYNGTIESIRDNMIK